MINIIKGRENKLKANTDTPKTVSEPVVPPLFDYFIIFDDLDKETKNLMKRVNRQEDSHDAIMSFVEELKDDSRSAAIKAIYKIH